MKKQSIFSVVHRFAVLLLVIALAITTTPAIAQKQPAIKNIVIVHGAFADASGWETVFKLLTARGYHVTLVQNPLSSLADDVTATTNAIDKQDGPVVLVGHSWGGTVITQAGNSPRVQRLVYVAAFVPEVGESTLDLVKTAMPAPENGILPPDEKGLIYYDKTKFHAGFAADLPADKVSFMYASQAPIAVKAFLAPVTEAAWKSKPSFALLPANDKSISPDLQRTMYKRAGLKVKEVAGSHAIYISKAAIVADLIIEAATATK